MTKTVWVRGRPVRGALMGLLMGLGSFLLLTKFELVALDTTPLVASLVGGMVVGVVRALIGRPYRLTYDSPEGAPTT